MIFTVLTLKGVCNPSLSIQEFKSRPVLQSAGAKLMQKTNQLYSLLLPAGLVSSSSVFKHVSLNVNSTYEVCPGSYKCHISTSGNTG